MNVNLLALIQLNYVARLSFESEAATKGTFVDVDSSNLYTSILSSENSLQMAIRLAPWVDFGETGAQAAVHLA